MLRFFRKIRHHLLSENKMKKYLLYGLGEIMLVVIGILLALQVNNWNADRNNRTLEKKILKQLHTEFLQNKIEFEKVTTGRFRNLRNCNKIIEMFPIDPDKIDLDSLSSYFKFSGFRGTFNPMNGAINTLESSTSFDIISNESLRSLLIEWKDIVSDYLEDEAITDYHLVNYWDPYIDKKLLQRMNKIPKYETIYDDRVNLSFLKTIEFENLVFRRKLNLERIIAPSDDVAEYEKVRDAIDRILELSKRD